MADVVETPEQKIARLEKELAEAQGIIGEQTEQLAVAEVRGADALPVVTHEKQQYRVLAAQFSYKDKPYKAADLSTNKELVAELITAGSGILHKIEKEKK